MLKGNIITTQTKISEEALLGFTTIVSLSLSRAAS